MFLLPGFLCNGTGGSDENDERAHTQENRAPNGLTALVYTKYRTMYCNALTAFTPCLPRATKLQRQNTAFTSTAELLAQASNANQEIKPNTTTTEQLLLLF